MELDSNDSPADAPARKVLLKKICLVWQICVCGRWMFAEKMDVCGEDGCLQMFVCSAFRKRPQVFVHLCVYIIM